MKHWEMKRAAWAQTFAYRVSHPDVPILLFDTHAGNGCGVPKPQRGLGFNGENGLDEISESSALMMGRLSNKVAPCKLFLCEIVQDRRDSLRQKIRQVQPAAVVLSDNNHLLDVRLDRFGFGLGIVDPCGLHHPIEVLQHVASRMPSDFILTFNRGAWGRVNGLGNGSDPSELPRVIGARHSKQGYEWMEQDWTRWAALLNRKCVARTRNVKPQSANFRYRLIVVADYFADCIKNNPDEWEIYRR
jgi:hypothetical protein